MSGDRIIQNLALVGFMGTGKSAVGKMVSNQLRFHYLDTDALIESRAAKPITQIFAEDGEARFRELERAVVENLKSYRQTVIATGGGLVTEGNNLDSLRTHALVICLWASPATILKRTAHQPHRPLLQTPDPEATVKELLAKREPYYRRADVLISTEFRSAREVASQVIHQFRLAGGRRAI